MIINKENMIDMLGKLIDEENASMNKIPLSDVKEVEIYKYKMGYVRALKNLLFAISVNGE